MCNGEGILEDGGFWMQKLEGGGYAEKTAEHGGWCDRCRGVGSMPIRKKHSRNPLTARPKKDSGEGSGYTPDDSALTRYAIVSRRLDLVAAAHGKAMVEVLVAYYGDVGSRWGRTPHGRLFAVYALTGAGHKLVRMSMARTSEGITLSAAERIGVEAETEKTQPKPNRRALLDAAAGQALTLYERASAAWNATKSRATHLTSVTNEVGEMVPFVDVKFGPLPVMGTGER